MVTYRWFPSKGKTRRGGDFILLVLTNDYSFFVMLGRTILST